MNQQSHSARIGIVGICGAVVLFGLLCITACSDIAGTNNSGPPPDEDAGIILAVAGTSGGSGNIGDEGPASACMLKEVCDVTVTPEGDILVVDWGNHRIRRIDIDGVIHGFVGSGIPGDDDSGEGPSVDLWNPAEVKVSPDGSYYVSVFNNDKIKVFQAVSLECSVHAGGGGGRFLGDGGPAIQARLDNPRSLVLDPSGNMYIADEGNSRIRKIDAQTGIITTFAGGIRGYADGIGEEAQFSFPDSKLPDPGGTGIELSPDGENILLADTENHRIRLINIATRLVTTIAGTGEPGYSGDGGPALFSQLNYPTDVAVSEAGEFYIADAHNHVIRKIDAAGMITTVAGTGFSGDSPSGTPAKSANLFYPYGVDFHSPSNTLYIADTYNHQVKKVKNP